MTGSRLSRQAGRGDCQVLIAGAGPTGLVLARGIGVWVIDKSDGPAVQTRALAVHARTLEVLDMMGLAGTFIEHGQVVRQFRMYADGRNLARVDLARNGSRFGFLLDIPQDLTVLRHGRHVLLIAAADRDAQLPPGPWQDHVEVVRAPDGLASRADGVYAAHGAYLVRPDGHLAARGPVASPGALLN